MFEAPGPNPLVDTIVGPLHNCLNRADTVTGFLYCTPGAENDAHVLINRYWRNICGIRKRPTMVIEDNSYNRHMVEVANCAYSAPMSAYWSMCSVEANEKTKYGLVSGTREIVRINTVSRFTISVPNEKIERFLYPFIGLCMNNPEWREILRLPPLPSWAPKQNFALVLNNDDVIERLTA